MASKLRLRFPELLEHAGITAWGLHKQSNGRITAPTAYRLVRNKGAMMTFHRETLEALCDVLGVSVFDLWEEKGSRSGTKSAPAKRSAAAPKKAAKKAAKSAKKAPVKRGAKKATAKSKKR